MVKVGPSPLRTSRQAAEKRSASSLMEVNLDPKDGSATSTVFHASVAANKATKNAQVFMVISWVGVEV